MFQIRKLRGIFNLISHILFIFEIRVRIRGFSMFMFKSFFIVNQNVGSVDAI